MALRRRELLASVAGVAVATPSFGQPTPPDSRVPPAPGPTWDQPSYPSLDLQFLTGTLDSRISFSRADGSAVATCFNSSGVLGAVAFNYIRNSTMQGAVVGTPGTLPTNWQNETGGGLLTQVIGSGTESGIPYIDIRVYGTAVTTFGPGFAFEANTNIAAVNGQTWTCSFYQRLVGGSFPVRGNYVSLQVYNGSGTFLTGGNISVSPPSSAALASQRVSGSLTIANASAAYITGVWYFQANNGDVIDFTIRIGAPQLELASSASAFIPTSGTASGAPRFDYDPSTLLPRGLLIEESRTNALTNSAAPQTLFTFTSATATANAAVAPDGTTTMALLLETTASTAHYGYVSFTVPASQVSTFSIFGKAQNDRYLQLFYDDSTNGCYATFDLTGGTITGAVTARGTGTATGAWMTYVGNGIYRCSIAGVATTSTAVRCGIITCLSGNPSFAPSYTGNASNGLYIWGAQLEAGAFATSYIPTTSASVTRAADVATMPAGSWFNAVAGTLDCEGSSQSDPTANANIVQLDDGSAANIIGDVYHQTDNQCVYRIRANNVLVFITGAGVLTPGVTWKLANSFSSGSNALALNGSVTSSNAATYSLSASITTLRLGCDQGGASILNGYLRRVRYWPRALSAGELQSATT